MVESQTVRESVNKGKCIGFSVTTSGSSAVDVITPAQIAAVGAKVIRDIHLKCTGGDAFLGLGKTATTTPGEDNIPIFQDESFDKENLRYTSLSVIRAGSSDVTVKGYVVVN